MGKKKEKKEQKQEKQTNCLACNKPLSKKSKYYRNGKYYCDKKCFKKLLAKQEKEKQAEKKEAQK